MRNTFNNHIRYFSLRGNLLGTVRPKVLQCLMHGPSFLSKGMAYFLIFSVCLGLNTLKADTYHDNQHLQFWLNTLKQSPFVLLQKNAARQLGLMGDMRAKPELEYQAMNHPSHEVRAEALYALGRMGSMGSMTLLQQALNRETHPEAQKQAQLALDILEKRRDYIEQLKQKD